jgi:hypothetical protein
MQSQKVVSFASLNATKQCENKFTFPFIDENGDETSLLITVIGDQSKLVKDAIYKKINKDRIQEALLKKKGKDVPVKPIEDVIDENIEGIVACIVDWTGIDVEYSPEKAFELVSNNQLILEQVKEAAGNLSNFSKSK